MRILPKNVKNREIFGPKAIFFEKITKNRKYLQKTGEKSGKGPGGKFMGRGGVFPRACGSGAR